MAKPTNLHRERELFRAIIEASPYGICVTDLDRRIVFANGAAATVTGYGPDELVGKPVSLYAGDGPAPYDIAQLRAGERVKKEAIFARKDGAPVPVIAHYRLMEHPVGERSAVIVEFYSDQSDRKRLDRLKNEFVFVAAHELRNPVTAFKLLLNIIFEDKRLTIDPILRNYLLKMQEANERLIQLVDDLLEVSRSEAGRLKITVSPQDISEHVVAILNELKPTAVTKDVELRYVPMPNLPRVMADSTKLKEIFANLVSNAIKYNVAGGTVLIEHELAGKFLSTTVADTGIGISEADRKRLFEKFWRSEEVAVRAQAGTGLGLFIVHELVDRMGGSISVHSKPGKGTSFTFLLPLAK